MTYMYIFYLQELKEDFWDCDIDPILLLQQTQQAFC